MFAIDDGNTKYDHRSYYDITKQAWQKYCDKYKIDFIFIDKIKENILHPKWNKHCVFFAKVHVG